MVFELPELPWSQDALDPHISAKTMSVHYGKHHAAYVTKLNAAVEGTPYAEKSLEEIIRETAGDTGKAGIFNNAAQTYNHTFFWNSLSPNGGGQPGGRLQEAIVASFGSYEKFVEEFKTKAATLFGSGWTWLVSNNGKLEIVQTYNAGTPISEGKTPLITLDVWEHAYYLDYQNRRPDFIATYFDKLINWNFAEQNYNS